MKLVNLRADEKQHQAWKKAANKAGLTFSEWTRITLDAAALGGRARAEAPTRTLVESTTRQTARSRSAADRSDYEPPRVDEPALVGGGAPSTGKRTYKPDFKAAKKR